MCDLSVVLDTVAAFYWLHHFLSVVRKLDSQKRLHVLYAHVLSQVQDDLSCASILPERFTASLKKPVYLKSEDYACSLVWNRQEGFSVSQDHAARSLWGRLSYNLRKQISSQTVEGHAALLFMSSFAVCCDSVCHAPVLLSRRLFALLVCQNAVPSYSVVR